VDPLGNLTCANEYDVYGNVRARIGTPTTEHGFVGQLGHLSDASTGLIYMRARYYDPGTGRFASEDSKQSGDNWFVYCDGNPVDNTDSSGNTSQSISIMSSSDYAVYGLALAGLACGLAYCAFRTGYSSGSIAAITDLMCQNSLRQYPVREIVYIL
jgi:RHS repeat-associated protein